MTFEAEAFLIGLESRVRVGVSFLFGGSAESGFHEIRLHSTYRPHLSIANEKARTKLKTKYLPHSSQQYRDSGKGILIKASLLLFQPSPSISLGFQPNMIKTSGHLYSGISIFHSPSVSSGPKGCNLRSGVDRATITPRPPTGINICLRKRGK
jgi:hypothetical protein